MNSLQLERCDTELKLMATGYNFKRIFNENEQKIQFIRKKVKDFFFWDFGKN